MRLSALKALGVGGVITSTLYMFIMWIIPLFSYVVIFGLISLVSYAFFSHEEDNKIEPPK
jgi:hypothetical protein